MESSNVNENVANGRSFGNSSPEVESSVVELRTSDDSFDALTATCFHWLDDESDLSPSHHEETLSNTNSRSRPGTYQHVLESDSVDSDLGELMETSCSDASQFPEELNRTAPVSEYVELPNICGSEVNDIHLIDEYHDQIDEIDLQLQQFLEQNSLREAARAAFLLPLSNKQGWTSARIGSDDASIHAQFKKVVPQQQGSFEQPNCTSTPNESQINAKSGCSGSSGSADSSTRYANTTDDLCLVLVDDEELEYLGECTSKLALAAAAKVGLDSSEVISLSKPNSDPKELQQLFRAFCDLEANKFLSDNDHPSKQAFRVTRGVNEWSQFFCSNVDKVLELWNLKRELFVSSPLGKDPMDLFQGKTLQQISWKVANDLGIRKIFTVHESTQLVRKIRTGLTNAVNNFVEVNIGKLFVILALISDVVLNEKITWSGNDCNEQVVNDARHRIAKGWEQLRKNGLALKRNVVNWEAIGLCSEQKWRNRAAGDLNEIFWSNVEVLRLLAAKKFFNLSFDDTYVKYGVSFNDKCSKSTSVEKTDLIAVKKACAITKYSKFQLGPVGQLIPLTPKGFVMEDVRFLADQDFELFNKIAYKSYVSPHMRFKNLISRSSLEYKSKCIQVATEERNLQIEIGNKLIAKKVKNSAAVTSADHVPVKKSKVVKNARLEQWQDEQFRQMKAQYERFKKATGRSGSQDFPDLPMEIWEEAGFGSGLQEGDADNDTNEPGCSKLKK